MRARVFDSCRQRARWRAPPASGWCGSNDAPACLRLLSGAPGQVGLSGAGRPDNQDSFLSSMKRPVQSCRQSGRSSSRLLGKSTSSTQASDSSRNGFRQQPRDALVELCRYCASTSSEALIEAELRPQDLSAAPAKRAPFPQRPKDCMCFDGGLGQHETPFWCICDVRFRFRIGCDIGSDVGSDVWPRVSGSQTAEVLVDSDGRSGGAGLFKLRRAIQSVFGMLWTERYRRAPVHSARVQAASTRSRPKRLARRISPKHERYPCSGCGRSAMIFSHSVSVIGPTVRPAQSWGERF